MLGNQRLTARWEWVFITITLLSALFFITVFSMQWFGGDDMHLMTGRPKGGDLMQHYAAGIFWKNNLKHELYEGYSLGEWINKKMEYESGDKSIQRFNYVYAPLIAWFFAKATYFPFYWWIQVWMWGSLALFLFMWMNLLDKNGFGIFPLEKRNNIFWYGIGFPSFFYSIGTFQISIFFFSSVIFAMYFWQKEKKFEAGLMLSLWIIKPHLLALWVFVLFLLKHYKTMWGCITGGTVFLAVSVLVTGWQPHVWWISSLINVGDGHQLINAFNSSWRVFWISVLGRQLPVIANILYILTFSGILYVFLKWIKEGRRRTNWISTQELPVAGLIVLLLSPYTGHYEWILALVWAMAVYSWTAWTKRSAMLLLTLMVISLFSIVSVATQFSITPLLMTIWLAWSFQEMIKTQMAKEK